MPSESTKIGTTAKNGSDWEISQKDNFRTNARGNTTEDITKMCKTYSRQTADEIDDSDGHFMCSFLYLDVIVEQAYPANDHFGDKWVVEGKDNVKLSSC